MSTWLIAGLTGGGVVAYAAIMWWVVGRIHEGRRPIPEKRRYSLGCPAGWIRFRLENPDRYYAMPEWSPMLVLGVHVRADEVNVGDEICVVLSDGASDRGRVLEIVKVDRPATLEKS